MWQVLRRGARDKRFWFRHWLDWDPHEGQLEWAEKTADESGLSTGSRWGKSEIEACDNLWIMFHHPEWRILNCSITIDQARIVIDKMAAIGKASDRFEPFIERIVDSPFPMIGLTNSAETWSRSTQRNCKFVRGHSFHKINYDEIAYGSPAHLNVLLLRLADHGGPFSWTTTSHGRNFVYREAVRYMNEMRAQLDRGVPANRVRQYFRTGPSWENPHVSRAYLENLQARLPEDAYRQEVLGEFVDSENTLFPADDVDRITNRDLDLPPDEGGVERSPVEGGVYVAGWDLGRKSSWTVGTVLRVDKLPWRGVLRVRMRKRPWPAILSEIERVHNTWGCETTIDSTGLGDVVLGMLEERRLSVEGVIFSPTSKQNLLIGLKQTVQTPGGLEVPFWRELYDQMIYYNWDERTDEVEEETQEPQHWDDLMSLALAVHKAKQVRVGPLDMAGAGRRFSTQPSRFSSGGRSSIDRFTGR